jgi:signal transduction histidine kinase
MSPASHRFHRQPLGIRRKLAIAFVTIAAGVIALAAFSIVNLVRVQVDSRRFVEEDREAKLAFRLLAELEPLQAVALEDGREGVALSVARGASELVGEILRGPSAADPSDQRHQKAEYRIIDELDQALDRLGQYGRGELTLAASERAQLVGLILAWAEQIEKETTAEVRRSMADLDHRVDGLFWTTAMMPLFAMGSLALLYGSLHRWVVHPLDLLRRGAESFGGGELDHRIVLDSRDEMGELAFEFNRMAERLASMQRSLEDRVRERTREFISAARLADLGTLAAGIAHEVNTPLASIASCAEGLDRRLRAGTATREEELEYLGTIAREAYRAHEIASRLLGLARRDSGPVSAVAVNQAVTHAAQLLQHQIEGRGVVLDLQLGNDDPWVDANPAEIEQAVVNVMKNAIEASPLGGRVIVRSRALGDHTSIEVEDEGPGIAPPNRERIFDPFFTTKAPGKGTGLGLSLAYRIVENLGGRIELRDAPGGGALFEIALPRSRRESTGAIEVA